ncbi:class II fructose-bisphosphate aldolase [Diplocloster hominis]|uniref:class II fructose-bisphosphate aldolase n=1 Tax=Diplocloster hominis TaxID=3079010 RepID=UPI0031BA0DAC
MRIPMSTMLQAAKQKKYGCPAPNVFSWDDVKSCFELSVKYKAPVIIDMAPIPTLMEPIAIAVAYYNDKYPGALVTLNLDHGDSWENIMLALRYGFDSVMIDRSMLGLEENIRETAEVVRVAHAMGVSVEAELGHVGYNANYALCAEEASALTDPEEASHFVEATDVDCLAVSVGTSHGVYSGGVPHLEFDLLSRLSGQLPIPLVLHGGSSTGDENLKKAVELGIQKVNLCSDLCNAGYDAMIDACSGITNRHPTSVEVYDSMAAGYRGMLEHYLKLFGGINVI